MISFIISVLGFAAGIYQGYQWGFVKGYQQKEDDDKKIESWR
jgi:hypothetical protein